MRVCDKWKKSSAMINKTCLYFWKSLCVKLHLLTLNSIYRKQLLSVTQAVLYSIYRKQLLGYILFIENSYCQLHTQARLYSICRKQLLSVTQEGLYSRCVHFSWSSKENFLLLVPTHKLGVSNQHEWQRHIC